MDRDKYKIMYTDTTVLYTASSVRVYETMKRDIARFDKSDYLIDNNDSEKEHDGLFLKNFQWMQYWNKRVKWFRLKVYNLSLIKFRIFVSTSDFEFIVLSASDLLIKKRCFIARNEQILSKLKIHKYNVLINQGQRSYPVKSLLIIWRNIYSLRYRTFENIILM